MFEGFVAGGRNRGDMAPGIREMSNTVSTSRRVSRTLPVLCAGLQSSGSTWLFNIVVALYKSTGQGTAADSSGHQAGQPSEGQSLAQFYADSVESFPNLSRYPDALVIKTHIPDKSLRLLAEICASSVLISVRDPRDAIGSLMARFKFDFETALRKVVKAARHTVELSRRCAPLILRYEDRFYDDAVTVSRIAAFLGLSVSADEITRIWASLTADSVKLAIEEMKRQGVFGEEIKPTAFDPDTHWHPGHVGDLEIGKYARTLSHDQQALVVDSTQEYFRVFGYDRPGGLLFSFIDDPEIRSIAGPAQATRQDNPSSPWPYRANRPQRYVGTYARYLARGGMVRLEDDVGGFVAGDRNRGDMARFYSFSLAFDQIVKEALPGDLAELGVWKGNTASLLATMARRLGRTAYLLDTFEGFSDRDLHGIDAGGKPGVFSDTSLAEVRALVGDENVRFVKGYFPDTTSQLPDDAAFCLVHLDCDLYAPMMTALQYFYPRLVAGGFLIVHD